MLLHALKLGVDTNTAGRCLPFLYGSLVRDQRHCDITIKAIIIHMQFLNVSDSILEEFERVL